MVTNHDMRVAARAYLSAIDAVKAAQDAAWEAGRELALRAEGWQPAKLAHAVQNEADGMLETLEEYCRDEDAVSEIPLAHIRREALDFLELVEVAAADDAHAHA